MCQWTTVMTGCTAALTVALTAALTAALTHVSVQESEVAWSSVKAVSCYWEFPVHVSAYAVRKADNNKAANWSQQPKERAS